MTQRSLSVLVVLNVVLLAAIALTFGPVPQAQAQFGGGAYLMIAGNSGQTPQQIVYIMDTKNGRVVALTINSANKRIEAVGAREVGQDLEDAEGGGRGRR